MGYIDKLKEKIEGFEGIEVDTEYLKQVRRQHNITMEIMGKILGISTNGYCNKENNQRKFSLEEIVKISVILEIDINDMLIY